MRTSDPRAPALLSPATRPQTGSGSDFPSGVRVLLPLPLGEAWPVLSLSKEGEGSPAVIRWRVAQERPDQGRACPKAAQRTSLRAPRAIRATQRARSAAKGQRIRLAFLLLTFLWALQKKSESAAGPRPGSLRKKNIKKKSISPTLLQSPHPRINPTLRNQIRMRPPLNDLPVHQHEDLVRVDDSGQPVRNHQRGLVARR